MLTMTIEIIAILSMLTFMFTSIWGFILLIKIFNQLRYKNYLMEKLTQNTYRLSLNYDNRDHASKDVSSKNTCNPAEKEILEA